MAVFAFTGQLDRVYLIIKACLTKIRHISNMHADAERAVLILLDRQGVVQILGIGWVHRKYPFAPKILAGLVLSLRYATSSAFCCLFHWAADN